MNNLMMLEMALKQLQEYSTNEWVIGGGYRYNINTVLSQIKGVEGETYSQKMQNELEPIEEPLDSKSKLYDKTGVPASGCVVEGGMVVQVNGLDADWTFHTTDDDCEFENE